MTPRRRTIVGDRRAGVYVLVLGASALVGMIGLAAAIEARTALRLARLSEDTARADVLARTGLDHAVRVLEASGSWRTKVVNNTWFSLATMGGVAMEARVVDEIDGDLGDDPNDEFRVAVRGVINDSARVYSAVFRPVSTGANLLENGSFESGVSGWIAKGCTITPLVKDPADGAVSLKVTDRTSAPGGPRQDVSALIEQTTYTISGYARSNAARVGVSIDVETLLGTRTFSFSAATGNEWTAFSGTLKPSWLGQAGAATIAFYAAGTDDLELDGLSLTRSGASTTSTHTLVPGSFRREANE